MDYRIISEELYYDMFDRVSDEVRDMLYDNTKKLSDIECGWICMALDCAIEQSEAIKSVVGGAKIQRVLDIFNELKTFFKTLEGKDAS